MTLIATIFPIIEMISTAASGLLAGALLTEARVLVPYWRKMNPREFLALHHTMAPSLFRFFAPITIAGTMLPCITLLLACAAVGPKIYWWVTPALLSLVMLAIYFCYFKQANMKFATASIAEQDLSVELSKWSTWHNLRTCLAIVCFGVSIFIVRV